MARCFASWPTAAGTEHDPMILDSDLARTLLIKPVPTLGALWDGPVGATRATPVGEKDSRQRSLGGGDPDRSYFPSPTPLQRSDRIFCLPSMLNFARRFSPPRNSAMIVIEASFWSFMGDGRRMRSRCLLRFSLA